MELEDRLSDISKRTNDKNKKPSRYLISPELVLRLFDKGMRLPQIAAIYGCSPATVSYQMKAQYDQQFDARKHIRRGRYDITIEEVVELYEKIGNSNKIAEIYGVNTHAITERLEKAGVKRRPLRREDINVQKVVSVYNVTKRVGKTAEILGTNVPLIRRRLNEAGIAPNNNWKSERRRKDIPAIEVIKRYDSGESMSSLSQDYNASLGAIRKIIVDNGGDVRKIHRRRTDLTPEKVSFTYKKLKRVSRVAEALHTQPAVVRKRLNEAGVSVDNSWRNERKRDDISINEVIKLRSEGLSIRKISRKYNCGKTTIEKIVRKYG